MKTLRLTLLTFLAAAAAAEVRLDGPAGSWVVELDDRAVDVMQKPFLGRPALWLRNNTHVLLADVDFEDGVIEFDVAPMTGSNFFALMFRRATFQDHENVYFRPWKSGTWQAVQYAPRLRGSSTWQLYPEFHGDADLPENEWTHVRVVVAGARMELFLGAAGEPLITVPRLRSESLRGAVGFWARINDQPKQWAAAVSNVVVRPAKPTGAADRVVETPEGVLSEWEVSRDVLQGEAQVDDVPRLGDWVKVSAEESGLVNLTRVLGRTRRPQTAVARTVVRSASARQALLEVGYSDAVTVFLNGRPLYHAQNGWESRYPGYLGYVQLGDEAVYLDLKAGDNELVFVVADDQRFGWGLAARLWP